MLKPDPNHYELGLTNHDDIFWWPLWIILPDLAEDPVALNYALVDMANKVTDSLGASFGEAQDLYWQVRPVHRGS